MVKTTKNVAEGSISKTFYSLLKSSYLKTEIKGEISDLEDI